MMLKSFTRFRGFRILPYLMLMGITLYSETTEAQCVRIKDVKAGNQLTFSPKKNFACLTATSPRNATVFKLDFESSVSNVQINYGDGTGWHNTSGPTSSI